VSHLVNAPDNVLHHLMGLIINFENRNDEIERLLKLPSNDKRNSELTHFKQLRGLIYHVSTFFSQGSTFEELSSLICH